MVGAALTVHWNAAEGTLAPAASVRVPLAHAYVCAVPPTMPVMTPAGVTVRPLGPLVSAYVQGVFGQLDARPRLMLAPTDVVCEAGAVTEGAASTVQVKLNGRVVLVVVSVTVAFRVVVPFAV